MTMQKRIPAILALPEQVPALIERAGAVNAALRGNAVRRKPRLAAYQGDASGTVLLVARAVARRASHTWAFSVDRKRWKALPSTLRGNTTVRCYTRGTVSYVRSSRSS
jgi:hypothetical protein